MVPPPPTTLTNLPGQLPPFDPGLSARAVIDLDAIAANTRALRAAAPSAGVIAVVKADGYGHGLVPSARAALAGGATWLGVAQAGEALALRAAGITSQQARILAWLYALGVDFQPLIEADVDLTVAAPWSLDAIATAARGAGRLARVHLGVDTGLGRNGLMPDMLSKIARRAAALEAEGVLQVVGVWSHLAYADEPGHPTIRAQRNVFEAACLTLEAAGIWPEVRHLANSAATLTAPELHYDLVRPGLSLYGYSPVPSEAPSSAFELKPAMTLQARLATVKPARAGHGVSYSHRYVTSGPTTLGVVPLGYADGIPRHASGDAETCAPGGPVLVGAGTTSVRVVRVAGRVCMDQFVLDLGPDAAEQVGDVVTLWGASDGLGHGSEMPNAEDWAAAAGTISYEIFTRLGPRVPRVYVGVGA